MRKSFSVSGSRLRDLTKFVRIITDRNKQIKKAKATDIDGTFKINELAKEFHMDRIMVVDKIIIHEGKEAKSFVLKTKDKKPFGLFRAGQYTSLSLKIGNSYVTRAYSISSSPKLAYDGIIEITVKNQNNGFVSNYLLNEIKVGDEIKASSGLGNMYYEEIRDNKNVIAIAGGSGINPFLSMAYAILDGIEDFNLTILYGSRTENSILFKEELDEICKKTDKVKVVYVLSDEKNEKYENGFITKDIIKKYAKEPYSIFICGPNVMTNFVLEGIKELGKRKKEIRYEPLQVPTDIRSDKSYSGSDKEVEYKLTIKQGNNIINTTMKSTESILVAIEKASVSAPSHCRSGECGFCRSKLVSGEVYIFGKDQRRYSDKTSGYIHPCQSFPLSDLSIEVPCSK